MNFLIKLILLNIFVLILTYNSSCNKCCPPNLTTQEATALKSVVDSFIILKKRDSRIAIEGHKKISDSEYSKINLKEGNIPEFWKKIDTTNLINQIHQVIIGDNNLVIFHLETKSDFFGGIITEKSIYYHAGGPPKVSYEDPQVKNICTCNIGDNFWYIHYEITD